MDVDAIGGSGGREAWVAMLDRIARPVWSSLAGRRLRATMPVEAKDPASRRPFTHLEAVGRSLAGLAPWLETGPDECSEGQLRHEYGAWVAAGLDAATAPDSPDRLNFSGGGQPLVDASFLAHAFLRAPRVWGSLDERVRRRLVEAFIGTRVVRPPFSNWLLFSATVEAFLACAGESWDRTRVDYALRQFEQWYVGDGHYGDGVHFRADYYNSFVIQPMLLDVLRAVGGEFPEWEAMRPVALRRAQRYAEVQERSIAPDGSFPAVGRSLTYRCGAFQLLAQVALWRELPAALAPAGVRDALGAAIERTLLPAGTFDEEGWLRPGLCGYQPELADGYISTGSLYLCATAFLPLGLPATDPFWAAEGTRTSRLAWSGQRIAADYARD